MVKKIPKKLHVGAKSYKVVKVHSLKSYHSGEVEYRAALIKIAQYLKVGTVKLRIAKREQWETFWHEVVHAILRDMQRHDLNNERFVNAFSRRLYQALESK
jgi:hypothetical protein